jgi:hypothetical protein
MNFQPHISNGVPTAPVKLQQAWKERGASV